MYLTYLLVLKNQVYIYFIGIFGSKGRSNFWCNLFLCGQITVSVPEAIQRLYSNFDFNSSLFLSPIEFWFRDFIRGIIFTSYLKSEDFNWNPPSFPAFPVNQLLHYVAPVRVKLSKQFQKYFLRCNPHLSVLPIMVKWVWEWEGNNIARDMGLNILWWERKRRERDFSIFQV